LKKDYKGCLRQGFGDRREEKMRNIVSIVVMVIISLISIGVKELNSDADQEPTSATLQNLTREQIVQIANVAILSMESEDEVERRTMDWQIAALLLETDPENKMAQEEVEYREVLLKRAVVIDELRQQNYETCLQTPTDCTALNIVIEPTEQEIKEILEMFFREMEKQQQGNHSAPFSHSQHQPDKTFL